MSAETHEEVTARANRRAGRSLESSALRLSGGLLAVVVAGAALAPLLAPYDPDALIGPSFAPPSPAHLLGTNATGQDLFSQLVWGARSSLLVAAGAATLTVCVGAVVGVVAATVGGFVDVVLSRLLDVFLALPQLPLLILIAAMVGSGLPTVVAVIGLLGWPMTARVVRSETLSLRNRGFVAAAKGFGGGLPHLLRRHLLPALGPILATGFINVAGIAVLLEAGLAFLGLGDPARASWGSMLNDALGQQGLYFTHQWIWWVLPPAAALTAMVLGFTFLGVGLEPRLNPAGRRTETSRQ
jgi:ABC-type dipeptide/oligopeptide/nickel transport system permease subunit